jgi:hypothetical protein
MGIYTFIESIENESLFKYLAIGIVLLYLFMGINIGLNIVMALVFGIVIMMYLNERDVVAHRTGNVQDEIKYETIKPEIVGVSPDSNLTDFLFTVQDFYVYNPQAYEEMIDNLKSFFKLNKDVFADDEMYTYYKLPTDKEFTDKFNRAHERLETIMNKYMNDLYDECNTKMIERGRNVITRHLDVGPVGSNVYVDEVYSYQFY